MSKRSKVLYLLAIEFFILFIFAHITYAREVDFSQVIVYDVPLISVESEKLNSQDKTVLKVYEYEDQFYSNIADIGALTRTNVTIGNNSIELQHGIRKITIDALNDQLTEELSGETSEVNVIYSGDDYYCQTIPMLRFLGANCKVADESFLEVEMPMYTIWESIYPDYKTTTMDYLNNLYGGEGTRKFCFALTTIADLVDVLKGNSVLGFFTHKGYAEDALNSALEVDTSEYTSRRDSEIELNKKYQNFSMNDPVQSLIEKGFEVDSSLSDIRADQISRSINTILIPDINQQSFNLGQKLASANSYEECAKITQDIQSNQNRLSDALKDLTDTKKNTTKLQAESVLLSTALTSFRLMQMEDQPRYLLSETFTDRLVNEVVPEGETVDWLDNARSLGKELSSNTEIWKTELKNNLIDTVVSEMGDKSGEGLLTLFTENANYYLLAVKIGLVVGSIINRPQLDAFQAERISMTVYEMQSDVSSFISNKYTNMQDSGGFYSEEDMTDLKNLFLLYYRCGVAFGQKTGQHVRYFGGSNQGQQVLADSFDSTTDKRSVANNMANYLLRLSSSPVQPLSRYEELSDDVINYSWIDPYLVSAKTEEPVSESSDTTVTTQPVNAGVKDIVLVLDTSASMRGDPIDHVVDASESFISTILDEGANIGVVGYNTRAFVCSDFSTDESSLIQSVEYLRNNAEGETNIEDGLLLAQSMLADNNAAKQTIVLMSDGEPNYGKTGDALVEVADSFKNPDCTIFTLGFFEDISAKYSAQQLMERIASPGFHYEVNDMSDLTDFFDDIADQINGQRYVYAEIACPVDVEVEFEGETLRSNEDEESARTSFGTLTYLDSENSSDSTKILRLKEGPNYDIDISGYDTGSMDYTVSFMDENGNYGDSRVFEDIEITPTTRIATQGSASNKTLLSVDEDDDGVYDKRYTAGENEVAQEYVSYWPTIAIVVIIIVTLIILIVMTIWMNRHQYRR